MVIELPKLAVVIVTLVIATRAVSLVTRPPEQVAKMVSLATRPPTPVARMMSLVTRKGGLTIGLLAPVD